MQMSKSVTTHVLLGKTHTLATKTILSGLKNRKEFTKHYIASTKSRDICQEHSPVLTRTSAKPLKVGPTARCLISEAKGKFHLPQIFSDGSGMILTEACSWEAGIGIVSSFRREDTSFLSSSVPLGFPPRPPNPTGS